MAAQQPGKGEETLEERIDKVRPVKLITIVKGAIDLMKKEDPNYHFEIINTHGTIAGASRRDAATVVFEDAKGFVDYIQSLNRTQSAVHPLIVLRGEIVIPAAYDNGGSSYSPGILGDKFDDGLAYLEHLPKVQAYFIPSK